jgi:hypothetical protein
MKIGLMSSYGHLECARYMDSREVTKLRGLSFSTCPIKTYHYWISSECQRKGTKGIPRQEKTNAGRAKPIHPLTQCLLQQHIY